VADGNTANDLTVYLYSATHPWALLLDLTIVRLD
jgi:hypothetical protein